MSAPSLSAGQALLLKGLVQRDRLKGRLGPLAGVVPRLEARGLVEAYAPGGSPLKTMVRITDAGRRALDAASSRAALDAAQKPKD